MSWPNEKSYTKHNSNPLYYCGCQDCKKARAILREAKRGGFTKIVLVNPDTGEEKSIDVPGGGESQTQ